MCNKDTQDEHGRAQTKTRKDRLYEFGLHNNMLGPLPTHAKKNWQEWVTTLTHAYNCIVSPVMGFSPYFLMFGQTPKIPLDIEMGVTLIDQEPASHQNYAMKL